ncbi:hypothetical protein VTK26DRAFT_9376 [Humicola hyalothermophila]
MSKPSFMELSHSSDGLGRKSPRNLEPKHARAGLINRLGKTTLGQRGHETRVRAVGAVDIETVQDGPDHAPLAASIPAGLKLAETSKRLDFPPTRIRRADLDGDVSRVLFVTSKPYGRVGPVAELVYHTVPPVESIPDLYRVISPGAVTLQGFHVRDPFVLEMRL